MPVDLQSKRRRLLQEREVNPIDVRIIAAANRDLEGGTKIGAFRQDPYFH